MHRERIVTTQEYPLWRGLATAILLCCIASPIPAAAGTCWKTAMSQAAMNVCANGEALREDRERVALLRRLMFVNSRRPNILLKVQAEESAWLAYRSAYVAVAFPAGLNRTAQRFRCKPICYGLPSHVGISSTFGTCSSHNTLTG